MPETKYAARPHVLRGELRRGLPPLPTRISKLPLDPRGYPIPWFVAEVDGKRDFRVADGAKRAIAVNKRLCWLCGEPLGRYLAFVIGPMCVVNRNTSEPPCHRDCAEFAAQACPFLILPRAEYRRANLPDNVTQQPHSIAGNPGACAIYITESFRPYRTGGSWLISLGEPTSVLWYCEGKSATRAQILDSFERRLPALQTMAAEQGAEAEAALASYVQDAMKWMPA